MRFFFGTAGLRRLMMGMGLHALVLASLSVCVSFAEAQTAPIVLPYTMSTFAGPHAAYTVGAPCGNSVALTTNGDGCLAPFVSVGSDPHDLRVDAQGYLYYIDNSGTGTIIHRINPYTLLETIYAGGSKVCGSFISGLPSSSTEGDGCSTPASDGVANNTAPAANFVKVGRGLGLAPNGDLYYAGYTDYYVHRIADATDLMTIVAGNGKASTVGAPVDGPILTSQTDQPRGADADADGNVYIADTANNVIRKEANGTVSTITALNAGGATGKSTAVPANTAQLLGPEDVQVDSFGNVYIGDEGNSIVRVIYMGRGTIPGVTAPQTGYIYTVAAGGSSTSSTYPTGGSTPFKASSIKMIVRKIAIDKYNNVYIGDGQTNGVVVWFLDHETGYMRVIAGDYGQTASTTPTFICPTATDVVGDGCPATQASLFAHSDMSIDADTQGNLYIGDGEGSDPSLARIRKVLSGLNFPATATGTPVTQNILIHFGMNDTPAVANPYVLQANGTDFTLGTANCTNSGTPNIDGTDDCILPVTFNPSQPGYNTATLVVTSANGGVNSFLLTGTGSAPAIAFDPGNTTLLNTPALANAQGIALDGAGKAYIADTDNNRVLVYDTTSGTTSVFAGGASSACGAATDSLGDGCAATQATLAGPRAVAIDTTGSVYIADTGNNVIRKVDAGTGVISLYAGGAAAACSQASDIFGDGCPGTQAKFNAPAGLTADNLGNLFVADTGNDVIREIASNGYVTVLAGTNFNGNAGPTCTNAQGATDSAGDGCSASQPVLTGGVLTGLTGASFSKPMGLAFDATGKSILVADTGNHRVRRIALTTTYSVTGKNTVSNIVSNPVTLVAGNGGAGTEIASGNVATSSELNAPTGVAVGADGTVYIADTGNNSVRMVTGGNVITTIAGITSAAGGTGSLGGSATATQFKLPGGIAVSPLGTLYIADSGNNRIISDNRSQISYDFGIIGVTLSSPVQNFTELNIGSAGTALPSPLFMQTTANPNFTLQGRASSNGSVGGCSAGPFAAGALCNLQAQYTPPNTATETATFTQSVSVAGVAPAITLRGTGAILTTTTAVVALTAPAPPAVPQFGGSVTLQATVQPTACSSSTPNCYATGTVTFLVDGNASAPVQLPNPTSAPSSPLALSVSEVVSHLATGTHTISCNYSGDNFYSAFTCAPATITIAQATTAAVLTATPNNAQQFTTTTLTATVSSTAGTPNGTVSFYANGTLLGSVALNPATGSASLTLQQVLDSSGNLLQTSNTTLLPGTYTLTCSYVGPANSDYGASACPAVQFTVAPRAPSISLYPRGCSMNGLSNQGTITVNLLSACPTIEVTVNNVPVAAGGVPIVSTADGSTTDATVFVEPSDSVSGTLTISCSGLPAYAVCGFLPTFITLTAGTSYVSPIPIDITFFTDVPPSNLSSLHRSGRSKIVLAVGWPLTLLGLAGIGRLRRRKLMLPRLAAMVLLMIGSSLVMTSCAGPGVYTPVLTPAGIYPVTVTVTGGGVTAKTVIDFQVGAPGIPGQQ